ncbi:MAG: hypothetical protein AB8G22_02580, partial [Saprospiraceae bacterium]
FMKAEIEMHKNATFQGLESSLRLCAYLLSQFKNPQHAQLFLAAKQANFDTHCGFDFEHLVAAGIEETYSVVQTWEAERAESFYEYMGQSVAECNVLNEDLAQWSANLNDWFPTQLTFANIVEEIDFLIKIEERELLKSKIIAWEQIETDWSEINLQQLAYYKGLVNDTAAQIQAKEQLFLQKTTAWDKISALQDLSKLYLKVQQSSAAWQKLKAIQPFIKDIPAWKSVGLGRFAVEAAFDIVINLADAHNQVAQEAFLWAATELSDFENWHLNLLKKAVQSCVLMEDRTFKAGFEKKLKIEQAQFDELFGKK